MNFLEKNVTPRDVSQEAKTERLVEEEMSIRGEVALRRSFILLAHFVRSLGAVSCPLLRNLGPTARLKKGCQYYVPT